MKARLAVVLAVIAAAGACSSGDDDNSAATTTTAVLTPESTSSPTTNAPATTTTTPTSATTTTTGTDIAADRAAAAQLLPTLADVPSGWKTLAYVAQPVDAELGRAIAACLGIEPSLTDGSDPAIVQSDYLVEPAGDLELQASAEITTTARAGAILDALSAPAAPGCQASTLNGFYASGGGGDNPPTGAVTIADPPIAPIAGQRSVTRLVVPRTLLNGQPFDVTVDQVVLVEGRTTVTLSFQGNGTAWAGDEIERITELVRSRLPAG